MDTQPAERPAVLDDLTTTQMAELQRQYDDRDRASFEVRIDSYGLDPRDDEAIWAWFDQAGPGGSL
jgi:hypothetical protein